MWKIHPVFLGKVTRHVVRTCPRYKKFRIDFLRKPALLTTELDMRKVKLRNRIMFLEKVMRSRQEVSTSARETDDD